MRQLLRWQVLVAVAAVLAALGLSLQLAMRDGGDSSADYGGTYVEGIVGSPIHINPLLAGYNETEHDLVSLIFSGLTRFDTRGEVKPDLAEGWEVTADGLTYTFQLRKNAAWHDGKPVIADDVVFTVHTIQDLNFQGDPDLAAAWERVVVAKVDERTVRFELPEPCAPFLANTTIGLLPAHLLSDVPARQLPDHEFNTKPIGTGPFRFQEGTLERLVLMANPDYHLGRPYLANLEVRFFHDYPTAATALEKAEIDGLMLRPEYSNNEQVMNLRRDGRLEAYTATRSIHTFLLLNLKSPVFEEKALRHAILYGLDRQKIVTKLLGGQGVVADTPLTPGIWADGSVLRPHPYDPEQAKKMLDMLGWTVGEDGLRAKDGATLAFSLLTNEDPERVELGNEIVRQLKALGVDVRASAVGFTGLARDFLMPGKFDAVLVGRELAYDPDVYPAWHSSRIGLDNGNYGGFANEEADDLLEKARRTLNPEERIALYHRFEEVFADELPSLILYYPTYTYFVDKKVQGIELGVLLEPGSRFQNVHEWYIKTKQE